MRTSGCWLKTSFYAIGRLIYTRVMPECLVTVSSTRKNDRPVWTFKVQSSHRALLGYVGLGVQDACERVSSCSLSGEVATITSKPYANARNAKLGAVRFLRSFGLETHGILDTQTMYPVSPQAGSQSFVKMIYQWVRDDQDRLWYTEPACLVFGVVSRLSNGRFGATAVLYPKNGKASYVSFEKPRTYASPATAKHAACRAAKHIYLNNTGKKPKDLYAQR